MQCLCNQMATAVGPQLSDINEVGWYDLGVGKLRVRVRAKNTTAHDVNPVLSAPAAPSGPDNPSAADVASFAGAMLKLPDSVVIVDEEGNVVWGNASALRMFGLTLADGVGISGFEPRPSRRPRTGAPFAHHHSGQRRRRPH